MEMGTKTKKKLSENILEKFSMDFLRNQVLKNAYGNDDTVIAKLDPRILIVWYLFFGLVPWFVNDLWFLMACFLLVVVTTKLARVAGLVLLVFAVGVFSQTGYLLLVSLLFGGNASTIAPLLVLSLKVATCSLASVTVFSGLDPDKLYTDEETGHVYSGALLMHGGLDLSANDFSSHDGEAVVKHFVAKA